MKRLALLFHLFLTLICIFVSQKVAFLAINCSYGSPLTAADWFSVVWHGLRLDLVVASYLMVVPLLVLFVGLFVRRINYRSLLTWWYLIAALLMTLAFVADTMLYRYWGAKLDATDFFYAQNPHDLFASLPFWLVVVAFVVIVLLVAGKVQWLRSFTPRELEPVRRKPLWAAAMVLLLGLNFVGIRGGVGTATANPGYAYFSQKRFLNHAALNPAFNVLHSLCKNEDLANEFRFYDESEMLALTEGCYSTSSDISDTLLCRRPAYVVLLIWEGGGDLMLSDSLVAPCFSRLRGEGVSFDNCYANSFRTDRGLVSLLSGWPALPTTSVMKMSGRCAALPSLARSLSAAGYGSAFYYGGDIDFTNMRGYLFNTGYGQVEGDEGFASASAKGSWGVHDECLLRFSAKAWPSAPALVTYLTLSSHEPWEVPYARLSDERENAFAYTDSCLGAFVGELRRLPEWDSLLLIVVPDHGVARQGESLSDIAVAHIPMLWLGGVVESPRSIGVLMNQSDLPATLLAQMGLPAEDFPFSRNVLSAAYHPMAVHVYKNGLNLVDTLGHSSFDCLDGRVMPASPLHSPDAQIRAQALLQLFYNATSKL